MTPTWRASAPDAAWFSQYRLLPMLLWLMAIVQTASAAVCIMLAARAGGNTSDDPASQMFAAWQLIATANGLIFLITAAVWLAWQRRTAVIAAWQADAPLAPSGKALQLASPGWQLADWFIPLICLWRPLGDLRALHAVFVDVFKQRSARAGVRGSIEHAAAQGARFARLSLVWWICWLCFEAALLVSAWIVADAEGLAGARAGFISSCVAAAVGVVAAVMAVRLVHALGRQLTESLSLQP